MSKASLELGGGNWAAKDGNLLGYAVGDTSGKYLPREFDFTRDGDICATRVNEDGLIEKYRENLLLESNNFSTTWSTSIASVASVTSGESGYDGSGDVWLLSKTGANGYIYQNISQSGVLTYSVYAKAGTTDWIGVLINGSANAYVYFDLGNGVAGTPSQLIDNSIESVGNGWYRCSITFTQGTISRVRFYPAEGDDDAGASSGSIYIQDAQLEQGLVATDYLESGAATGKAGVLEDLPRIDYTGGSASLLLEPQRANFIESSEHIDNFQKIGSITTTANYGISPEGVRNSTRVQFTAVSQEIRTPATSTTGCTASVYIKGTNGETIKFGSTGSEEVFTLNGSWQRLEKYNAGSPTNITINTYSAATARDIEVWGAQVEEGSYPTSYIPTYGVSATRNADKASLVGSDLLDQDNQTLFIEYTKGGIDGSANTIYSTSDGTSSDNRMQIVDNNDDVYLYSNAGGSNILNSIDALLLTNLEKGDTIKVAVVMTTTSIKAFANGVEKVNFTNSFSWSATMDDLYIGSRGNSSEFSKGQGVKQALLFPTALTDSECIALTTL